MIKFLQNISGDLDEKQGHKIVVTSSDSSDGMYSLPQNLEDTDRLYKMSSSKPTDIGMLQIFRFSIKLLFENH